MAYADFTPDAVKQAFGLSVASRPFFSAVEPVAAPASLAEVLRRGQRFATTSEKARGEFIVAPILLSGRELLRESIVIYSGITLDVDAERGLQGECDFILGRGAHALFLQAPLLVILQAKKNDIEEGLGQCTAQMIGARLFNERHGTPVSTMYGCVTTGETWQFLELAGSQLLIDRDRYFLIQVDLILGILATILQTPSQPDAACDQAAPVDKFIEVSRRC